MKLKYDKEKVDQLSRHYALSLVILHGSYANGYATERSDIDVAFLGDSDTIRESYYATLIGDFMTVFGDKFDPVLLNAAEAMITYHVALQGKPLYEKHAGLFENFRLGAFHRYADTKKFRELEKCYIASSIKEM